MRIGLMRLLAVLTVLLGFVGAVASQQNATAPQMKLSSSGFKDMEPLPLKYTQTGTKRSEMQPEGMLNAAVSPPLEWSNVPPGTNAFVLMLVDHVDTMMWAVVNIPGNVRSLPEAIPDGNNSSKLPAGAWHRSFRTNGWIGSAAGTTPEGRWTYHWRLYPLDKRLDLPPDANREEILAAMEGHLTGNKAVMVSPCCEGSK